MNAMRQSLSSRGTHFGSTMGGTTAAAAVLPPVVGSGGGGGGGGGGMDDFRTVFALLSVDMMIMIMSE